MAYNVIIADDEKIICDSMKKIIDWESLELVVAATAYDGKTLLDMIELHKPRIVIADIKMPGVSGLDVVQYTMDMGIDIEYIIVSGYSDFEYVKIAMNNGVDEYLLKPISKVELIQALERCVNRVRKKCEQERLKEMIEENERRTKASLKQQVLREMLLGTSLFTIEMYKYCEIDKLENDSYIMISFVDISEGYSQKNQIRLFELCELFLSKLNVLFATTVGNENVIICKNNQKDIIIKCVDELLENYKVIYERDAFCVISDEFNLKDINTKYLSLKKTLSNSFLHSKERFIFESKDDVLANNDYLELEMFDGVVNAVKMCDYTFIYSLVDDFFDKMQQMNFNNDTMRIKCMEWIFRVYLKLGEKNNESISSVVAIIQKSMDLEDIKQTIRDFFELLSKKYVDDNHLSTKQIVEKIEEIVRTQYKDSELTIRKIGENYLYLTPDYISRIFKQQTGIGLNQYINDYRIKKAKELLKDSNFKIYEIAEMSGFGNNPQYFSHVFKKSTGLSPKEYLEL